MGDRITAHCGAARPGQFGELTLTHLQQAICQREVVIIVTDGNHRLAHLLEARQQRLIEDATELGILIRGPLVKQHHLALLGQRQQQGDPLALPLGEIDIGYKAILDGEPIADRNAYLALFSAIFTDYHLFQHLLGPEPKEALVAEWLERLQMGSKLVIEEGFITNIDLSQGQRKRVALLLALAEQREVMLFDEWAADQDPQFRRIFYQVLLPRLKEMGKTVIAISHDDLYFSLADRLLEMRQGQLIELTGERREQVSRDAVAHLDSEVPV